MDPQVCGGKCFVAYPGTPNALRRPCADGSRCISIIRWCDGTENCDDGSDEKECSLLSKINFWHPLIISVAFAIIAIILLHRLLTTPPVNKNSSVTFPAILSNPLLFSTAGLCAGNFQELHIEQILLQPNQVFTLQLIEMLQMLEIHPSQNFEVFQMLTEHILKSTGVDQPALVVTLKLVIGQCHQAQFFVESLQQPRFYTKIIGDMKQTVRKFRRKTTLRKHVFAKFSMIPATLSTTFYLLDDLKGIIFYLLLRQTFSNVEAQCENADNCLLPSYTEYACLHAAIFSIALSNITVSLYCFANRETFAKKPSDPVRRAFYDCGLFILSPFLPICFQMRILGLRQQASDLKEQFQRHESVGNFFVKQASIEKELQPLSMVFSNARLLENILEDVSQLVILCCLVAFYDFSYITPYGKRFTYFYATARSLLTAENKDKAIFFFGSMFLSLVGPCFCYLNRINIGKRHSLSFASKVSVFLFFFCMLLARVVTFVSTIVLPVLLGADLLQPVTTTDFSNQLISAQERFIFENNFSEHLTTTSVHVAFLTLGLCGLILIHLSVVYLFAYCNLKSFRQSPLSARLIHCLANIWLVFPFTDPDANLVCDDYAQENTLLTLHFVENLLVIVASRLGFFYLQDTVWPWRLHLYCDLPILLSMLLALSFHRLYHSKLKLFASVPDTCLPASVISARQQLEVNQI